jgi:CubicO group peptidase (beta-lactamase class C family)
MSGYVRLENLQARLDEFVARVQNETRVPGIVLGVSAAGTRYYARAGRRVSAETTALGIDARFHLGCAGKLLLAIAALELEKCCAVDTGAAIADYLPELRGAPHGDAVRVSHLLSHTSGYRGTNVLDERTRSLDWPKLVGYLRTAEPLFTPGQVFSYEHTETVLLGEILRRAAGKPCVHIVDEAILEPLGIHEALPRSETGARGAAGRHRFEPSANAFVPLEETAATPPFWQAAFSERTVSVADLLTIGEAVVGSSRAASGAALVSPTTRQGLQSSVVRLPATVGGPLSELLPVAFGLGSAELRDGSRGNTGVSAGQCLGLRFDGRTETCVAVGLNAMAPYLRDFVLTTVCRNLSGQAETEAPEPFLFDLAELEGTYIGPGGGTVDVRHEHERLVCVLGRERCSDKLCVELALDDDRCPVLRSPLPHLSLGFFRVSDGDIGLMLGLGAYKRRSMNRPFQR